LPQNFFKPPFPALDFFALRPFWFDALDGEVDACIARAAAIAAEL
jgi:hypothetical protein